MDKILKISELSGLVELLKENQQKLVFTNGCFDILHPGHVDYLAKASKMGDALIVGINTDVSVRRLKGTDRPINNLEHRMLMLAALESVDFIVPFDDNTPLGLIKMVNPDVLVKGADYKPEDIVGYDHVTSYGGQVSTIPLLEGFSSTKLIEKIKSIT